MYELGAKFGAHRCNHRLTFSHFGDEWFHVGALMASYYRVIKVDLNVDPSSIIEASRIGYFAAQERHYGEIYHDIDKAKLQRFYNHFGGKSAVLSAWDELTKDTCMQDWVVYERAS